MNRNATQAENHKHDNNHRTLVGKVQDSYFGCMQGLGVMAEKLSWYAFIGRFGSTSGLYKIAASNKVTNCWKWQQTSCEHAFYISTMLGLFITPSQTNVKIFNIVLNIQTLITRLPAQVERQQPVFLIDALGRHTPFHLEFITCAEVRLSCVFICYMPAANNDRLLLLF